MRKLLPLLAWGGSLAAGRDAGGVVLRTQDPEAVRALPLETGAARRDLQSSSDACHYVSVSGSTYQTSSASAGAARASLVISVTVLGVPGGTSREQEFTRGTTVPHEVNKTETYTRSLHTSS